MASPSSHPVGISGTRAAQTAPAARAPFVCRAHIAFRQAATASLPLRYADSCPAGQKRRSCGFKEKLRCASAATQHARRSCRALSRRPRAAPAKALRAQRWTPARRAIVTFFRLPGHPGKLFCMPGRRDHHIPTAASRPGAAAPAQQQVCKTPYAGAFQQAPADSTSACLANRSARSWSAKSRLHGRDPIQRISPPSACRRSKLSGWWNQRTETVARLRVLFQLVMRV